MTWYAYGPSYVFIASSTEGLPAAEEIHDGLERPLNGVSLCHATLWDQVFRPADFVIDRLLKDSVQYDYAVLVMWPDDYQFSRSKRQPCPRDNLNLEAGLFMASLGRKHCILVRPSDLDIKLPSDLAGLCCITYSHNDYTSGRTDLRPQIHEIRRHIGRAPYRNRIQSFFKSWGYSHERRRFGASLHIHAVEQFSGGNYRLVIGCFGGEPKSTCFTTKRFVMSEEWPVPEAIPADVEFEVDCSPVAEYFKPGDYICGILFLLRRGVKLDGISTMGEITVRGGRVLDGHGCMYTSET